MNKKYSSILRLTVIGLLALIVLLQAIPYGREHTNPPVHNEPTWNSQETRATFFRACGDCHSNRTIWPWYSHIAPVSWLISNHVTEGREHFNISEWGRKKNRGNEAAEEVEKGAMPLKSYLLLHPKARLSETEKQEFIKGLKATFGGEEEKNEEYEED
jgi:hypothetical protein